MLRITLLLVFLTAQVSAHDYTQYAIRIRVEAKNPKPDKNGKPHIPQVHGAGTAADLSKWGYKKDRTILTCAHLFEAPNLEKEWTILAESACGWIKCRVVKIDPELDLAIIEPVISLTTVIKLDSNKKFDIDTEVTFVNTPRGVVPEAVKSKIMPALFDTGVNRWARTDKFDHGCSGGGVYRNERLCGVIICGMKMKEDGEEVVHNIGIFVPLKRIIQFMDDKDL